MRAISLWQPWATAIAVGAKRIETRDWSTQYRGPLVIHAAKRLNVGELLHYQDSASWRAALAPIGLALPDAKPLRDLLPFGALVATCTLVDCRRTESFTAEELAAPVDDNGIRRAWAEDDMGNFGPSRFGWILEDIQPLRWPIPFKGAQGFFFVPTDVLAGDRDVCDGLKAPS